MDEIIFKWVGLLAIFLGSLSLALFAVSYILGKIYDFWNKWEWNNRTFVLREFGCRLVAESYFYSEDKNSMNAILSVGELLRDKGEYSGSQAIDLWKRKKEREKCA